MVEVALSTLREVEVVLMLVEAGTGPGGRVEVGEATRWAIEEVARSGRPAILGVNKMDRAPRPTLLPVIEAYRGLHAWDEIVPFSALTGAQFQKASNGGIDVKINGACVLMGFLYGNGNLDNTIIISCRSGQDSDCNPSNACGVLGVMIGYKNIPDQWKSGIPKLADEKFNYTDFSFRGIVASTDPAMTRTNPTAMPGVKLSLRTATPRTAATARIRTWRASRTRRWRPWSWSTRCASSATSSSPTPAGRASTAGRWRCGATCACWWTM